MDVNEHMAIIKREILERKVLDSFPESKRELFFERFLQVYKDNITQSLFQAKELDDKNNLKVINEKIVTAITCRKVMPRECVKYLKEKCHLEEQNLANLFQLDFKSQQQQQQTNTLSAETNDVFLKDINYINVEINNLQKTLEKVNREFQILDENLKSAPLKSSTNDIFFHLLGH